MVVEDTLFARDPTQETTLVEAAERIFAALGIEDTESRESSNYPEGIYFVGYGANASVRVCISDEERIDFPFWVTLSASGLRRGATEVPSNGNDVAAILAEAGWAVFVPVGSWYLADWDGQGVVYGGA